MLNIKIIFIFEFLFYGDTLVSLKLPSLMIVFFVLYVSVVTQNTRDNKHFILL